MRTYYAGPRYGTSWKVPSSRSHGTAKRDTVASCQLPTWKPVTETIQYEWFQCEHTQALCEQLNKDLVGALGVVGKLLRVFRIARLVERLLLHDANRSLT